MILAALIAGALSVSPPHTANTITFGANSKSCGGGALCSRDGTRSYLNNGQGQAFKASTIRQWFQVDVDGKSHLRGQTAEPLRGSGAFVVVNDTGRPISKFALRIATDAKPCATKAGQPCHTFAAQGGSGSFRYSGMLTARDRHSCTGGKAVRDICMGDSVSAAFASNKMLYSWTAKPQGAIPPGAYFLIQFSGWTISAWAAPPTPPAIVLLSKASDGSPGDNDSRAASGPGMQYATPDGTTVVFSTASTNLPGASASNETIYLYNRTSNALTAVSTEIPNSYALNTLSSITADGGTAMFYTNNGWPKFYVYDAGLGTTQTLSWALGYVASAVISLDGAYVLSEGTGYGAIMVYDRAADTTTQMLAPDGNLPDNAGCSLMASAGQFSVVGCTSDNIVPGTSATVYSWDQFANTFQNIERSTDGGESVPAGYSDAAMSPDARFVAYYSYETDLVPGGTSGRQVFVYDRQTGVTQLASAAADGTQGNETNDGQGQPSLSSDGRYVGFYSNATNLVSGVNNTGEGELYIKDLLTGDIQELSLAGDGTPADCVAQEPKIDDLGQQMYFESCAGNLTPAGNAGHWQVYLATLQ